MTREYASLLQDAGIELDNRELTDEELTSVVGGIGAVINKPAIQTVCNPSCDPGHH